MVERSQGDDAVALLNHFPKEEDCFRLTVLPEEQRKGKFEELLVEVQHPIMAVVGTHKEGVLDRLELKSAIVDAASFFKQHCEDSNQFSVLEGRKQRKVHIIQEKNQLSPLQHAFAAVRLPVQRIVNGVIELFSLHRSRQIELFQYVNPVVERTIEMLQDGRLSTVRRAHQQ